MSLEIFLESREEEIYEAFRDLEHGTFLKETIDYEEA